MECAADAASARCVEGYVDGQKMREISAKVAVRRKQVRLIVGGVVAHEQRVATRKKLLKVRDQHNQR
jgi:hypothetical protein